MSTRAFSKAEVLAIHSSAIAKFGGLDGIRDEGLLDSALAQPFQSFGGEDLYPSTAAKACRYAFEIIRNHPFVDGNKRTATALMAVCLRTSGYPFKPKHAALLKTMMGVADASLDYDELLNWVNEVIA